MKLPADATISLMKFTQYLLLPQSRSDKSLYLARAGYTLANVEQVVDDLRAQILPLDAVLAHSSPFGETYLIDGWLRGPSGSPIHLRTVWQRDQLSGAVHFVTLVPQPKPIS